MTDQPIIDDRTQPELLAELTERANRYVDDWDAQSVDEAAVLLRVAAEFGTDLIGQLNRVPEKHRAAFLDTLGFERRPPQAARLPLSVTVSDDLDRNVSIPSGTQAVATADEEIVFEVPQDCDFEATPASLTTICAVDPEADRLTSHRPAIDGVTEHLFGGENRQRHALYLGDDALFTLDPGSAIEIECDGEIDAEAVDRYVRWEYYGFDTDGVEGWHRLPPIDRADSPLGTATSPSSQRGDQPRLSSRAAADDERYSIRRRLPNEFVSTTVAGIESKWLRCRLDEPAAAAFATEIESVRVTVGGSPDAGETTPDAIVANDVPLSPDDNTDIRPFGRLPQPSSALYLAAAEVLSKPGAEVTLSFHPPDDGAVPSDDTDRSHEDDSVADFGALNGPPEISWEYWNGSGWSGLTPFVDDTDCLRTSGDIVFEVPTDIEETAVSGHEGRWIRARLVDGSYGRPSVGVTDAGTRGDVDLPPSPRFGGVSLAYDHTEATCSHVLRHNNAVFEPVDTADGERFSPFKRLPEDHQAIYFGFDDVLRDGPIPLFVALAEASLPKGFDPAVRWECCTDPETDTWSTLSVADGTADLTERGIVSLSFPEPTTPHERFGTRCHWIRAVVTGDSFRPETAVGFTEAVAAPPVVDGIYPNTQWATNTRTIDDEILGSSDGSPDQTFDCAHGPVIDCEVWVDESTRLSAAERADLCATHPNRIDVVTDQQGDIDAVWVRWTAVDRFVDDRDGGRHYRLDRSTGTVTFGDGNTGVIPPRGQDSIKVTYTTGGGIAGNVPSGAITDLKTPISLVESVENPLPADGGAAAEPTDTVASRAATRLRTRQKAVTASDYERIAKTAVRKLAAVECQPHRGPDGGRQPGRLTLVIVPEADRERPTPSMALEDRVRRAVDEAAPATVATGDTPQITVHGPTYVPVSVDATVRTTGIESLSAIRSTIESALSEYLHPTDGDADGTGWAFGQQPTADGLRSRLRSITGVAAVPELSTTVTVDDGGRSPTDPSRSAVPDDGLVCDGEHSITITGDNQ